MNRVMALEKTLSETQSLVAKYRESKKRENEVVQESRPQEEEEFGEAKSEILSSPK